MLTAIPEQLEALGLGESSKTVADRWKSEDQSVWKQKATDLMEANVENLNEEELKIAVAIHTAAALKACKVSRPTHVSKGPILILLALFNRCWNDAERHTISVFKMAEMFRSWLQAKT